jgi:hypothetical protein
MSFTVSSVNWMSLSSTRSGIVRNLSTGWSGRLNSLVNHDISEVFSSVDNTSKSSQTVVSVSSVSDSSAILNSSIVSRLFSSNLHISQSDITVISGISISSISSGTISRINVNLSLSWFDGGSGSHSVDISDIVSSVSG